jgi:hypothetical protein
MSQRQNTVKRILCLPSLWALAASILAGSIASHASGDDEISPATAKPDTDSISKIDGAAIAGRIERIDDRGGVWLVGAKSPVALDELASIKRPSPSLPARDVTPSCAVDLLGGGRLLASEVTIRDQQCHVRWAGGEPLTLPVERIAAIRFRLDGKDEQVAAALAQANRDVDRIFVNVAGAPQAVEGVVESLDANEFTVEWQGKSRKLPRKDVQAVVLAVIGKPPQRDRGVEVQLHDGSAIFSRLVSLSDGKLNLEIAPGQQAEVDWRAVDRLGVRSTRLAFVSDLTPTEALEEPVVTLAMPWQRDRSVEGRPLTIAGRTFDKGLGVHARSLLRYDIAGRFDELLATIGIDAEAGGRGDCVFVVQADDRELYRQRVRGGEPPRDVKLKVSGARQLTLLVEPGEDLDMADHADWANARLLRLSE